MDEGGSSGKGLSVQARYGYVTLSIVHFVAALQKVWEDIVQAFNSADDRACLFKFSYLLHRGSVVSFAAQQGCSKGTQLFDVQDLNFSNG